MRLSPLKAFVLVAVVLAACSGGGPSVEDALQRMVLQPEDLPEEVERGEEAYLSNEEAAAGSAERQSMLESWGRVLGFEVTYEPSGGSSTALPVRGVNVSASLYETEDGAADSFADAATTAEETDWQANYSGLRDFQQEEIEAGGAAEEIMWLRLSGVQSALDGDDELVTDDLIFFREGRERGFLRVQAVTSETDDRAHYARTVEGWLATLVENVKNALAELGDGG